MGISEEIKQEKFKSEYEKAIVNIIFTNSWLNQQHVRLFKESGLTTPQYNILRILRGQHPNPATVNLLIDRMIDKSSNASRIVDRLEQKGLVKRSQCAKDRRAVDVLISDMGLQLLDEMDIKMGEWQASNINLTEQEASTLNTLLDKIRE
ncbi:DNA-binding transcriptional regulator, MarR family [Ekhidna lutea]|uniref:DNA-binding transcriptional regulator, MarR family n=1 Tax=Ekhidna lutea TaxID=447679 RepID=A0A239HDR5_EKHLU|nr:MarR family transcriptional regulator [Ekhidna lutea]SNS79275.1 DNA-binding transcriptional regulator, MarR family [Ekhidna lutea]